MATNGIIDICTPLDKVGSLQSFSLTDCANYPTPIALSYTKIGCLEDERDGKLYEVPTQIGRASCRERV